MKQNIKMGVEQLLALEEIKKFNSLQELYLYLKKESAKCIAETLDNNDALKERLFELATGHRRVLHVGDVQITNKKDAEEKRLVELAHTFFNINSGCGNTHLTLNLNNYLKKDRQNVVYSVFVFSNDGQGITYSEELSGSKHFDLNIPDNVFFRHLPLMYMLSRPDYVGDILFNASQRKYPTAGCENVNINTGKVYE